jgi:hypothetical protein
MPPIVPNTARRTKRWKITIGEDEYQGHTSAIEIPSTPVIWRGGDDNTIVDDGDVLVNITMAQDVENAESLYRLMYDNPNTPATLEFSPHYDGTFVVSVDVTLVRPPVRASRDGNIPEVQVALNGAYTPPVIP